MTYTTTELPPVLSSTSNDTQAAIDAGLALGKPVPLSEDDARFYSVTIPAGAEVRLFDMEEALDRHREAPRRKTGTYVVHDAQTFVDYVEKHGHGADITEVWADIKTQQVVGVLNAHAKGPDGTPGWCDHMVKLQLHKTPAWLAWGGLDKTPLVQLRFAEHIEARRLDVLDPDAATLTEIARTFKATKSLEFYESRHLSTGQVQLQYHEEIDARAGTRGDIEIPETFNLALEPYEGSETYGVSARLRFDISSGHLVITYVLERTEEVLRRAFGDIVEHIENSTDAALYRGLPSA